MDGRMNGQGTYIGFADGDKYSRRVWMVLCGQGT